MAIFRVFLQKAMAGIGIMSQRIKKSMNLQCKGRHYGIHSNSNVWSVLETIGISVYQN